MPPAERAFDIADMAVDGISDRVAAARKTDLPEHGGERDRHPENLFAPIRPLQAGGAGDHGAAGGHLAGQSAQAVGRDPGQPGGPVRRLGNAVGLAAQIGGKPVEPDSVAIEKAAVVAPFVQERVGDAHHDRGIGARLGRQPFGVQIGGHIGFQRADIDEADAVLPAEIEIAAHAVL